MDKLIEDLNLISLETAECMTKVSLSPDHGPRVQNLDPIDDDLYCVEGRLNYHLDAGECCDGNYLSRKLDKKKFHLR